MRRMSTKISFSLNDNSERSSRVIMLNSLTHHYYFATSFILWILESVPFIWDRIHFSEHKQWKLHRSIRFTWYKSSRLDKNFNILRIATRNIILTVLFSGQDHITLSYNEWMIDIGDQTNLIPFHFQDSDFNCNQKPWTFKVDYFQIFIRNS